MRVGGGREWGRRGKKTCLLQYRCTVLYLMVGEGTRMIVIKRKRDVVAWNDGDLPRVRSMRDVSRWKSCISVTAMHCIIPEDDVTLLRRVHVWY